MHKRSLVIGGCIIAILALAFIWRQNLLGFDASDIEPSRTTTDKADATSTESRDASPLDETSETDEHSPPADKPPGVDTSGPSPNRNPEPAPSNDPENRRVGDADADTNEAPPSPPPPPGKPGTETLLNIEYRKPVSSSFTAEIIDAAVSPDGRHGVVLYTHEKEIAVWNTGKPDPVRRLRHDGVSSWRRCVFSPDGRFFAACPFIDGEENACLALVWEVRNWELRHAFKAPSAKRLRADALEFNATGDLLACSIWGSRAWIWDTATGELRHEVPLREHAGEQTDIAFAADDSLIAFAGGGGVDVWEPNSGAVKLALNGATQSVAFNPDASHIACGLDGYVEVYAVEDGKRLERHYVNAGNVRAIQYGSREGRVLSASDEGDIRLWREQGGWGLNWFNHYKGGTEDMFWHEDEGVVYSISVNGRDLTAAVCRWVMEK